MPDGELIKFHTVSISTGGAGQLEHIVGWESSTGDLADLANVFTREHVSWDAAPAEFGASGVYTGSGEHHGLGQNNSVGGVTNDSHSIIPPMFVYASIPDGSKSETWLMHQQYEVKPAGGDWQPIPGATYEITRWFERQGQTLVAYCAKRGTGTESIAHQAMVQVPNWFEIEISAPQEVERAPENVDKAVVDKWNEDALKSLSEGQETAFVQHEDLVIIRHPTGGDDTPYWNWAKTQDWFAAGAKVIMVKKGGAFGAGSIKAIGVSNTDWFEQAIARVSKKKVTY